MRKPLPQSFGVSPADVAALDRFDDQLSSWVLGTLVVLGAIAGFVLGLATSLAATLLGPIFGVVIALVIGLPLVSSWTSVGGLLSGRIRGYVRFKAANRAFEEWDLRTRTNFWQSLSGRDFERELTRLFKRRGYRVELTPHSGDHGVDIFLRRGSKTTAVQCKQTRKPIGPAMARELYGSLVSCGADDGILAVTGGVTNGVREFLVGKPITVLELPEIIAMQKETD